MTARRRRLWIATAAAAAGLLASSYFWWWKPIVLASIQLALAGALSRNLPQASFGSLEMAGIQTVVVHDLSYGKPQDDFSVMVPLARFTFSFWHLATGKLDPVSSLKSVVLVNPQVILTLEAMGTGEGKGKTRSAQAMSLPLPAQAQVGMKNGRILLRSRRETSRFVSLTDMDASVILPGPGTAIFEAQFTSPDSPRRGVEARGVLTPSGLSATLALKKLRLTPLAPWIRRFNPPVAPEMGSVSCSLAFSATRTADGRWSLTKADGKMETDGVALSGPALPFRLREITGSARFDGGTMRISPLTLLAPETKWEISGSVENPAEPVLHLTAQAGSFELGKYLKGAGGHGTLSISAEGPASNPALIIRPDLGDFRLNSFSCARLQGRFTAEDRGKRIKLDPGTVTLGAGEINAWGSIEPEAPGAILRWTFSPVGAGTPSWAGNNSLVRNVLDFSAKSSDGKWVVTGRSRRESGSWNTSLAGHSSSGGVISLAGKAGAKAPFRLSGTVSIKDATLDDLNITGIWGTLSRIKGGFDGTGQLSGDASQPVLALAVDGRNMALDGEKLGLTGSIRLDGKSLQLAPLKLGQSASFSISVPFEKGGVGISGNATGLPLPLALSIAGAPDGWRKSAEGAIRGDFATENPGKKDGTFHSNLEISGLSWKGTGLGNLSVIANGKGPSLKFNKLRLNGPRASVNGSGSLEFPADGEWNAGSSLTVNYLKKGLTDLDCLAKLAASGRAESLDIRAELSSVRLSGTPYPDAEISLEQEKGGASTIKFSWEDLAYASASLKDAPNKTIYLTAALSDFPVAPAMGLFSLTAPAKQVSGSISIKGPVDHATLSASLKWEHGEADARGWIDSATGKSFSLSLTAVDGVLMPWVSFIRTIHRARNIPELDGRLETRGLTLEREGESLSVNGWVGAKDLRVGGVLCGNGSFRITSAKNHSEFEASLDGPQGKYTLYPTRVDTEDGRNTLEGAFAWSGMPLAKARCSLSRAELNAVWTDDTASANLALTGLGLEDRTLDKTSIRLERKGDKWRISSPKESPWQAIGTVTIAGTRVTVEEDERTGGKSVLIRGGDGTSVKAGGTWAPPSAPENFTFEAHRLPASPLFAALGMPPAEGTAEADLEWNATGEPPLAGRLTLLDTRWGSFPVDSVDTRISGTPGRSFTMTSLRLVRGTDLSARGTGKLVLYPEQSIKLDIVVEKLVLRYLKPLGFLDDSESTASGKLSVSGTPQEPRLGGTLTCLPGTVKPRTGFSSLYLTEGKLAFSGSRATLSAALNDITGASLLVNGNAEMNKLSPDSFTLALTAPQPVKVDDLPNLFRGTARGSVRFEGTPESPVLRGEVVLETGQLRTPPSPKKGAKDSLAERLTWNMEVGFGKDVQYVIGAPLGGEIELAHLSPASLITIKGKGADFKVAGEVLADSGPLTLFLGQRLWKK